MPVRINIGALVPYPDNPFALYVGKRRADMIESVREHGIISPIVVRPLGEAAYQILSGHNRVEAARSLGLADIPAVVKTDLSDDEAALIVTETNLIQRSFADLKHSERAVILKNHLEALKKLGGQGKRNDLLDFLDDGTCAQFAPRSRSRDTVARRYALSKDTVMRYVRLARLPQEILNKVDLGILKLTPAVEISWLSDNELKILVELIEAEGTYVSLRYAKRLREESEKSGGRLTKKNMLKILSETELKRMMRNISLPYKLTERLEVANLHSSQAVADIISQYLDMLERGEAAPITPGGTRGETPDA
jgi:ParB family chromosome partitioning protein